MADAIGILDSASPFGRGEEMDAFYNGLTSIGVDPENTRVIHAWADNDYTRLPDLAEELANNADVKVIVAAGGPASAIAAQIKTQDNEKPVVFTTITDPRPALLVQNLDRPEKNVTGTYGHTTETEDQRLLGLSILAAPGAIGVLANPQRPFPRDPNPVAQQRAYEGMAAAVRRAAIVVNASTDTEIDNAFDQLNGRITGLLVTADALFNSRRYRVLALAERLAVPAMYQWRAYVADGGLMSFGPRKTDGYRIAGEYAARVINGALPENLPVRQTTTPDLFVSTRAAHRLKLDPQDLPFRQMADWLGIIHINWI